MGKRALWIAVSVVAVCAAAAGGAAFMANRSLDHEPSAEMNVYRDQATGQPGTLPVMWHAPSFAFPDQHGTRTMASTLLGHVWVADFFFTECTTVCPLLSAKMVLLERQIPDPGVRFVSFSVDPEHDTPDVLAHYLAEWNPKESRWLLLHTDEAGLHAVAKGMRVAVRRNQGDAQNPILHTNLFFLVDAKGNVRGIYPSNDEAALGKLVEDTRTLVGSGTTAAHPVVAADASGAQIFGSLGCGACHGDPRLAPSLQGIAGTKVHLSNGSTVTVDDAYLRESVETPAAKIVAGYLRLMPSYAHYLTDAQLGRLVAYVRSLPPAASSGAGGMAGMPGMAEAAAPGNVATLTKDPVCGMQVRAVANAPHTDYQGHTYYFCSDTCRTKFAAEPAHYAHPH